MSMEKEEALSNEGRKPKTFEELLINILANLRRFKDLVKEFKGGEFDDLVNDVYVALESEIEFINYVLEEIKDRVEEEYYEEYEAQY